MYPSIVEHALFERARAIIDARSAHYSDDELLALLQDVLRNEGYLSGIIIDEQEDMPSSSVYRRRFGSLIRAYQLIGYVPERDYSYIDVNRSIRDAYPRVLADVIAGFESTGGHVTRHDNDLLTINGEFTTALVIARACIRGSSYRWHIRLDTGLLPDLTIAVRLNTSNTEALDYYVFPSIDFTIPNLKLRQDNAFSLDAAASSARRNVASIAFPLVAPWHLVVLFAAALAGVLTARCLLLSVLVSSIFVTSVLAGLLPSPIAAGVLAATSIAGTNPLLAAAFLLFQTSIFSTAIQIAAQPLHLVGMEAAAPALLTIVIVGPCRWENWVPALGAMIATIFLTAFARSAGASPLVQMFCASLPAIALGAAVSVPSRVTNSLTAPASLLALLLAASWIATPPRSMGVVHLILPKTETSAEGKYFKNYKSALSFSGISSKETSDPASIPNNAVVMLPWLTAPLDMDNDAGVITQIGDLARKRGWIVILAAEHNDLGGSAKRIATLTKRVTARNDLTVPPGNTDDSGPLHVLDFRAWPHEAILNRGASVEVSSLWDKVLLSGDGWWAERDIGEWLWVGDYVWQTGDRAGRLALSMAFDDGASRWVIVGDNSPFINSQIYADPRPVIQILINATLWPVFLRDLALVGMIIILAWRTRLRTEPVQQASLSFVILLFPLASFVFAEMQKPPQWRDTYIGQSGFDQRNFNEVFAEHPDLLNERRVIRATAPVSDSIELPASPVLIFARVDGTTRMGNIIVGDCRRIGSLQSSQGPYLMDAQACRIGGDARILIGTQQQAAAIEFNNGPYKATLVLDTAFLAQNSPKENVEWLIKEMDAQRKRSSQE